MLCISMVDGNIRGLPGRTHLHLRHIATFLPNYFLGRLNSHVQIILICHCDHVAIVLDLNLEVTPDTKLLPDQLPEFAYCRIGGDENVAGVGGMAFDSNFPANATVIATGSGRLGWRSSPRLCPRYHFEFSIVDVAAIIVVFFLFYDIFRPPDWFGMSINATAGTDRSFVTIVCIIFIYVVVRAAAA